MELSYSHLWRQETLSDTKIEIRCPATAALKLEADEADSQQLQTLAVIPAHKVLLSVSPAGSTGELWFFW